MIERERRRLERVFRLALVAAAGPAAMMACDASNLGVDALDAGAADATVAPAVGDGGPVADGAGLRADSSDGAKPPIGPPPGTLVDAGDVDAYAQGGCYLGAADLDSSFGVDSTFPGLDTCAYYYGCGLPQGLVASGCAAVFTQADGAPINIGATCWFAQDAGCDDDVYAPNESGATTLLCFPCFGGGGRRPAGLSRERAPSGAAGVGAYLAALAFEEDASVTAFARMRTELTALGAPRALVRGASSAARDEVRHARVMARLAVDRGGRVAKARVRRGTARSAIAIAAENAAEGCVRETFGALLAKWQASHASDAELARAFTAVARDEARHAALSWALARWIEPRLDAKGRARVAAARRRAVGALAEGIAEPGASLARDAGLPTASQSRALLASMTRELALPASTTSARR